MKGGKQAGWSLQPCPSSEGGPHWMPYRGSAPVDRGTRDKETQREAGYANVASYKMSCFRFRWMIMSWTDPIVILSRFVSVALVKWP